MPRQTEDVVLDTLDLGDEGRQLQIVRADAIERVMPLRRDGMPEHLQGLFWMDQWGMLGTPALAKPAQMLTLSPEFDRPADVRAIPEIVMSFAGMPYTAVGDTHVTTVVMGPTDVPTWATFTAYGRRYVDSVWGGPGTPPFAFRATFDARWASAQLDMLLPTPPPLRFRLFHVDGDLWHRKTFAVGDDTTPVAEYLVHRIVDGDGNRLANYEYYLATARLRAVSGSRHPGTVVVGRLPGATDNAAIASRLAP